VVAVVDAFQLAQHWTKISANKQDGSTQKKGNYFEICKKKLQTSPTIHQSMYLPA